MIDNEYATKQCLMVCRAAGFADVRRLDNRFLVQTELETCFGRNSDISPCFDGWGLAEVVQTLN